MSNVDPQDDYMYRLLLDETDRGCALIGGQLVDDALGDLLLACMGDTKAAKDELIMGGLAPLHSFSARIKLARHIGIISEVERADIDDIRWVRNQAAHVLGTHDNPWDKLFEREDVILRTSRFRYFSDVEYMHYDRPRMRYSLLAVALSSTFETEAKRVRLQPDPSGLKMIRAIQDAQDRHHHVTPRGAGPGDVDPIYEDR